MRRELNSLEQWIEFDFPPVSPSLSIHENVAYLPQPVTCRSYLYRTSSHISLRCQGDRFLTINVSNPAAVTITATGATPENNASATFGEGVDLLNFFTSTSYGHFAADNPTSLTTGDSSSGPTLDGWYGDNLSTNGLANVDLNLYSSTSGAAETFTRGEAAFSGSITLNLAGLCPSHGRHKDDGDGLLRRSQHHHRPISGRFGFRPRAFDLGAVGGRVRYALMFRRGRSLRLVP